MYVCVCVCVCICWLIPNFNSNRVKKDQMIQLGDKQIHKLIFAKKKNSIKKKN